jgi:hypothetical protein
MTETIPRDIKPRIGACEVCMRTNQQIHRYYMAGKWRQICVDAYSCMGIYRQAMAGQI